MALLPGEARANFSTTRRSRTSPALLLANDTFRLAKKLGESRRPLTIMLMLFLAARVARARSERQNSNCTFTWLRRPRRSWRNSSLSNNNKSLNQSYLLVLFLANSSGCSQQVQIDVVALRLAVLLLLLVNNMLIPSISIFSGQFVFAQQAV